MMKGLLVLIIGIIAVMYILNIGMGVIELIPDNIPFVGNLDEAGAVTLLLMCLRYFGIDVTRIFQRDSLERGTTFNN